MKAEGEEIVNNLKGPPVAARCSYCTFLTIFGIKSHDTAKKFVFQKRTQSGSECDAPAPLATPFRQSIRLQEKENSGRQVTGTLTAE